MVQQERKDLQVGDMIMAKKTYIVRIAANYTAYVEQEFTSALAAKRFMNSHQSKELMADVICGDLEYEDNIKNIAMTFEVEEHR